MYKYIALAALVLGSAALGFSMNRSGESQFELIRLQPNPVERLYGELLDVDDDGLDDFIRVRWSEEDRQLRLQARYNLGNTKFTPWSTLWQQPLDELDGCYPSYLEEYRTSVLDINGDGVLDVVLQGYYEFYSDFGDSDCYGQFELVLVNAGSGAFACAGDVTGDGATGVDDLLGVIADWGCAGEGRPD